MYPGLQDPYLRVEDRKMELRPLTEADLELTLAWRNDKEISQGFYSI